MPLPIVAQMRGEGGMGGTAVVSTSPRPKTLHYCVKTSQPPQPTTPDGLRGGKRGGEWLVGEG